MAFGLVAKLRVTVLFGAGCNGNFAFVDVLLFEQYFNVSRICFVLDTAIGPPQDPIQDAHFFALAGIGAEDCYSEVVPFFYVVSSTVDLRAFR